MAFGMKQRVQVTAAMIIEYNNTRKSSGAQPLGHLCSILKTHPMSQNGLWAPDIAFYK